MDHPDIPEEVHNFLVRRIDSVPHLETLLLLWKDPSSTWTESEVAARVYVSSEKARLVLQDLTRHGLISRLLKTADSYQYDAAWDEAHIMPKVAGTYRRHLVNVATLIHAKTSSEAVRQFAQAFRLKGEDEK
jgi:hypothetical protein